MSSGTRVVSLRERENNKKRERSRRAITSKIYSALRRYGNYKLPSRCDTNDVLKALCKEAGWIVEEDGTTYRKGCRPIRSINRMDIIGGGSAPVSPCSPNHPSPCTSYNLSPGSSSFHSRCANGNPDASSKHPHHLYIHPGSINAPVTPLFSFSTCKTALNKNDWHYPHFWLPPNNPYVPSSTMQSPGRQVAPDSVGIRFPQSGPTSPSFSLVSRNNWFGLGDEPLSGMWMPSQSGTCSSTVTNQPVDVPMPAEFSFGSHVKAREGDSGESAYVPDDLELRL
ncbi:hypothetical protein M5689_025055 [Euphorbia peplus]|nr:hypothetical protein M5689_025055 [Euphorbia peplus]